MRERPPRPSLWIRVAAALLPARYRGEIVDDLVEERDTKIAAGRSRAAASIWLAGHVVRSAASSRRTARERGSWRNAVTSLMPFGRGWPGEWRQAVRALRRTPWYALTVIAVTTLGMALATTVFAVVDGVLFRSLPYPDASELYAVSGRFDAAARRSERFIEMASPNEIAAWAAATDVPVTGIGYTSVTLPDWSVARAAAVDRRFFDVFRVRLLLGGFSEDDYRSSLAEVMPIIISHRVWQTQFGGDPNVIGRTTPTMYSRTYQIVGVMAEDGFVPPLPGSNSAAARRANRVDVLTPPFVEALGERSSVGFARVPDAMRPRALAGLATAAESLRAATSAEQARFSPAFDRIDLVPLRDFVSHRERPVFAMAFATVMSLVGLVLLNAGALAAARAQERLRDLSLRRALGARTRDLVRHALTEQLLLSAAGTLVGLLAAPALLALVVSRLPEGTNLIKDAQLDWRVLAFASGLSVAAAAIVSLFSVRVAIGRAATRLPRVDTHGTSPDRLRMGRCLVAAQSAIAFVLVVGGVLFAASLARLWNEDPGFRAENAATMSLTYPVRDRRISNLAESRVRALELAQQLRGVPGVRGAAVFDALMMANLTQPTGVFRAPAGAIAQAPLPESSSVSSGFFAAAGVDLVEGRLPTDAELDTGAPVIAVSESVARSWWPGSTAIGRTLRARNRIDCTVVGVVRDMRLVALDVPSTGVIFYAWSLNVPASRGPRLFVAMGGDGATTLASVTSAIARLDPNVRPVNVQLLEDAIADTIRARRLGALAAQAFAVAALVFVAIGLLGLVAITSSRRTREVGIRLALGAAPAGIVRLFVREQLGAVVAGLAVGGLVAALSLPLVAAHLYGIGVYDPAMWTAAVTLLVVTALVSAWLPARRASRIDPVASLRDA
ncbi:MAG TPA: ABC transporter permease [Vicinamibacterales bacterium]|nr:ABC transporter permease [Vicinamibacterales bacterium]